MLKLKFYGRCFFRSPQNFWKNHKDKDIQKIVFACHMQHVIEQAM